MSFLRRLAKNRLLECGMTLVAFISIGRIFVHLQDGALRNDFAHYFLSSRLILGGQNPYTTDLKPLYAAAGFCVQGCIPRGADPPGLLWLFSPVALLPAHVAYWVWVAIQSLSLLIILWLTRRLLGERITSRGYFFVVTATVSSATVYWHFYYSQIQLLLAALVLAGYMCQRTKRETIACVLVTLAGVVKLYPFALLPWFVWGTDGKPSARIKRGLITSFLVGMFIVATGPKLWLDFFRYGLGVLMGYAINHTTNFTVPSFIANMGLVSAHFEPSLSLMRSWWFAGESAGVGILVFAYWLCLRGRIDRESQFCLLSVAMLAASVTSWGHYLVFLIFPMTVLAVRLSNGVSWLNIIGFAGLLILLNSLDTVATPFLFHHMYLNILVNYLPLYGLFVLGWFFGWRTGPQITNKPLA